MRTYIVRQPILDENQEVLGYEILYREESENIEEKRSDVAAANAIENFLVEFDSNKFLDGKMAFLTFTPNLLLKNIPRIFSPQKLVIQIDDDTIIHPAAQKVVYEYRKKGYSVAINGFEFALRYFSILDVVDIIKIDFSKVNDSLANIVNIGKNFNKKVIAYNVNNDEAYNYAKKIGCTYMQGSYVAEKLPTALHKMNHMQSNFFQLMVAITKEEPNVEEIEEIISRDVTLTYSLLKLVNSAYFALRHQAKSVKQALIVLGVGQLKQWIYLLSFKQDDGTMPSELIRISFLRANFCSELCNFANGIEISKSEAYLIGMFSTLGILMEVSLENALDEVNVSELIKSALLSYEGKCGTLYKLVLAYEKAEWKVMNECAEQLNIPMNIITQKYFECVEYVNNIWKELTSANNNEKR
ncbi:HDOD domain-containing protein [Sedimentibacter sp. zth1]|uniref:EAL and HDOD domain-containing protein n=1 Tax=Sedimentibacter sp. zth1 TaxID=2816908 RepID=UPI001A938F32|nr:HDOD domain-containing protein [Sedimentibacter sp. zth1]QSX04952.1 HDOD domain-containing protein [Sedimentibacter sp. zth1]